MRFGKALRQSIQASKCDFFLGIPDGHEMAAELVDHQLVVTRPYLIVGYILASPPGTKPATLADAMRAKRIGALTATPADLFLHKRQFNRVPYGNNRELLVALRDREIDLALVWSPAIAVQDMAGAGNQFGIGSEQPDDDSLRSGLAIATRKTDVELMRQIDSAIEGLKVDGAFAKISEKYGLPYLQSR